MEEIKLGTEIDKFTEMEKLFSDAIKENNLEKALGIYENANKACIKSFEFHEVAASAFKQLNDRKTALKAYGKAIALEPESGNYFLRGSLYQRLKQYENANCDYEQCLALDKENIYSAICLRYGAYCDAKLKDKRAALAKLKELQQYLSKKEYEDGRFSYCGGKVSIPIIEKMITEI
ncbi:MAG: hypothetical protein COA43_13320 [Robiginitomaculum sp.]|nr:MAG: hypothetical protein COA43_13320 [Robiginitomaculum sp.]